MLQLQISEQRGGKKEDKRNHKYLCIFHYRHTNLSTANIVTGNIQKS